MLPWEPMKLENMPKLKEAILRQYNINEEIYRQRFQSVKKKQGETNREVVARLTDFAARWTQGCWSTKELKDLVVLEQLLNILPEDVHIWVKERSPNLAWRLASWLTLCTGIETGADWED